MCGKKTGDDPDERETFSDDELEAMALLVFEIISAREDL